MDVVIANLIHTNLVQCALIMTTHVATIVVQDKTRSYIERALGDDFIPLAIEAYGCFHPCIDSFLISCVHASIAHH